MSVYMCVCAVKSVNGYFVKFYVVAYHYSCLCTCLGLLKYFDRVLTIFHDYYCYYYAALSIDRR